MMYIDRRFIAPLTFCNLWLSGLRYGISFHKFNELIAEIVVVFG